MIHPHTFKRVKSSGSSFSEDKFKTQISAWIFYGGEFQILSYCSFLRTARNGMLDSTKSFTIWFLKIHLANCSWIMLPAPLCSYKWWYWGHIPSIVYGQIDPLLQYSTVYHYSKLRFTLRKLYFCALYLSRGIRTSIFLSMCVSVYQISKFKSGC